MKKLLFTLVASLLLIGCNNNKAVNDPVVYDVEFDVDYNKCGVDPIVSVGGVNFGDESQVRAGRVASKNGYINISKIEADIDLSNLAQRSDFTGDWLNAAFYAVSSAKQPKGDGNYCDAEFEPTQGQPGYPCPFCQEIDFLETNGQKMFQHTLHLADAKKDLKDMKYLILKQLIQNVGNGMKWKQQLDQMEYIV